MPRTPQVRLPPVTPLVERTLERPGALQSRVADPILRHLLRRYPDLVAQDPRGDAILRNQVVAINPEEAALALARANGFQTGPASELEALGLQVVVLNAPAGVDTFTALARLRALDPTGSYDFNHLYSGSAASAAPRVDAGAPTQVTAPGPLRIGLIDSGVSLTHAALHGVEVHAWGCDGKPVPGAHGTAVASLLKAGTLYSADIYCGVPTGGSATAFAAAMGWMARQPVAVVNLSLVGPDNALLRRATEALMARGYVLVAAVGNDGPAAPAMYPAAYPGVLGVTAVDAHGRVLPEALRGVQVDFAAIGSGLRVANPGGGWLKARGTSYAAPLVAHAAAVAVAGASPGASLADKVRSQLEKSAVDLGAPGRDDVYGFGQVAAEMNGN